MNVDEHVGVEGKETRTKGVCCLPHQASPPALLWSLQWRAGCFLEIGEWGMLILYECILLEEWVSYNRI